MPSREPDRRAAEMRAFERLLRETTPPAAVTVNFRQRVVQASLDARLRQLSRRQAFRSAVFGLVTSCILLLPVGLFVTTLLASMQAGVAPAEFRATQLSDAAVSTRDGNDVLAIQQQLEQRLQNWLNAQRSSKQ